MEIWHDMAKIDQNRVYAVDIGFGNSHWSQAAKHNRAATRSIPQCLTSNVFAQGTAVRLQDRRGRWEEDPTRGVRILDANVGGIDAG